MPNVSEVGVAVLGGWLLVKTCRWLFGGGDGGDAGQASPEASQDYDDYSSEGSIERESRRGVLGRLDLHGSKARDVVSEVSRFLQTKRDAYNRNSRISPVVEIITGRGTHSTGDAVIKPILQNYLASNGYSQKWSSSGGSVIVDVRGGRP